MFSIRIIRVTNQRVQSVGLRRGKTYPINGGKMQSEKLEEEIRQAIDDSYCIGGTGDKYLIFRPQVFLNKLFPIIAKYCDFKEE